MSDGKYTCTDTKAGGVSRREFLRRSAMGSLSAIPMAGTLLSWMSAGPVYAARPGFLVRRNVLDLTQEEKQDFTNAILKLKRIPSPWDPGLSYYDQFVWWHKRTFDCGKAAAHMGPAFLPWHRLFLLYFENALNATRVSPNPIAIPYWHWPQRRAIDVIFSEDFMSPEGDPNANWAVLAGPFRRGRYRIQVFDPPVNDPLRRTDLVRRFGTSGFLLPTQEEVDAALAVANYDHHPWDVSVNPEKGFRNNLEGWRGRKGMTCENNQTIPVNRKDHSSAMHNVVHLWVGGIWGEDGIDQGHMVMNSSPNDPVFWLHHSNVDRLWFFWEQTHGMKFQPVTGALPGHNLYDTMWPYHTPRVGDYTQIADLLDINRLNYMYA